MLWGAPVRRPGRAARSRLERGIIDSAGTTGIRFPNGTRVKLGFSGWEAVMPLESGPVTTLIALLVVALAVALAYGNGVFG
jgi:hypothetical protein